ncbi:MAG: hypothetical protein ACK5NU_03290 [Fusobacterium ulcerans]|uniref:hypothetical protein n=1 Tax=Fusobacterium ulcerans TaxID=861 RepID=UPI003A8B6A50
MRDIRLEEVAKKVLVEEYGEKAALVDNELNELAKLMLKRKDLIKTFNKGQFRQEYKEKYMQVSEKIKQLIKEINFKLN